MMNLDQIVHRDPDILGGTPVFRCTRVPVRSLFDYLEGGDTLDEFLRQFPSVRREQAIALLEPAAAVRRPACARHNPPTTTKRGRRQTGADATTSLMNSPRGAGLLSKRRHQTDFHGREGLRDGAFHLGRLSNLLECGGVDAGNLAFGFELYAGDRETSRYRAEMDNSFRMDACRCVALLRQHRRQSHRETRRMSGGDKFLRVCAGAVLETRVEGISSL